MKYVVYIKEELERGVIVDAESREDAEEKVGQAYNNEKIVLDYSDYNGYEITCGREASDWDADNYIDVEDL